MTDLPSMPLYVDDFEAATAHLTVEEDGAYNRLLRLCWRTSGCSVPDDDRWIMRMLRVDKDTFERVVLPLIEEFFQRSRGRIFQKRQREIFDEVSDRVQKRKDAGKLGGLAKAQKNNKTRSSNAKVLPEAKAKQTAADALPTKAKTKTKEPPNPQRGDAATPALFPEISSEEPETPLSILSEIIPAELAQDFIDHRKSIKKPMTVLAATRVANELRVVSNPIASVNASIGNGWAGVFERDAPRQSAAAPASSDRILARVNQRYGGDS